MKQIYNNILGLLVCLLTLGGCRQVDVNEYVNDPGLYFYRGNYSLTGGGQADSIGHSFFLLPGDQNRDTLWIDIRRMGLPADDAQSVRIVQKNSGEKRAAVAGKHYVGFDAADMSELMKMPAGAVSCLVPVILLKDASLEKDTVKIEMTIVANDHFRPGIDKQTRFVVTTTAIPAKPAKWGTWSAAFGGWGPKKMWFIMTYLGITDFDDTSGFSKDIAYPTYLQTIAIDKLIEYNKKHEELKEADGSSVKF